MSAQIIKTARILKSNLLVTFYAARWLASLSITHGNNLFFPSTYLCCRGIFIKDSMPSWSVLLSLRRSIFLIQSTSTKLLCLNVPHIQDRFRRTKISILTEPFKYNPQDCFSLRSTGLSAFRSSWEPNSSFFKITAWNHNLLIATGKTPVSRAPCL